jgi:lysophospholipase L1-like esterase
MPIEECMFAMGAGEMYIMLGMNDGVCSNPDYYLDLYKTALSRTAERNPGMQIVVQSCTPVTKNREDDSLNNEGLDRFNGRLRGVCEDYGYGFVDISDGMKRGDNSLDTNYTSDNYVHMNNAGSAVWIDALMSYARSKYIGGEWVAGGDPSDYPGVWMEPEGPDGYREVEGRP